MTSAVITETDGPVCIITINRPHVRNCVDGPTAHSLTHALLTFDADPALKVAVLTGAGDNFCAGADLKALGSRRENPLREPATVRDLTERHAPAHMAPMGPSRLALSKPLLAAVEGYAVAGGLELALLADLRVASSDAVFGVFCRRWGVPLIDGGTVRLPRVIGLGRALDMILTGRPVHAQEALAWGLVNRVVAPGHARAHAVRLAHELAKFPQRCLRVDRQSAYDAWSQPVYEALSNEFKLTSEARVLELEALPGAATFAQGAGRGGQFVDGLKAVLFDLGGVVFDSPIMQIERLGREHGLPKFALNKAMAASMHWKQLERGVITGQEFDAGFAAECRDKYGWTPPPMQPLLARFAGGMDLRPLMVQAIRSLRERGYRVAAVTNNFRMSDDDPPFSSISELAELFDVIVESCVEGVRKPSPKIFEIAVHRLGVEPEECVFLDDIGKNLKAAAKLGIKTIKVAHRDSTGAQALAQLSKLLQVPLVARSSL